MTVKSRPAWRNSTRDIKAVYDWLAANGVDEMVPEDPIIVCEGDRIRYTAFVWDGPRGWDPDNWRLTKRADGSDDVVIEVRTVPLKVLPDARVAELLRTNHAPRYTPPPSPARGTRHDRPARWPHPRRTGCHYRPCRR